MTWPQGGNPDPYGQHQPGQPADPHTQYGSGYDSEGYVGQSYTTEPPYSAQPYSAQPASGDPYQGQQYYQQPYQQPMYAQPVYAMGQTRGTNTMAILALVFAFVFPVLGIVFGHMAKTQIKTSGEDGDGLATAGLIIGYILTGIGVLCGCLYGVGMIGLFGASTGTSSY